MPTANNQIDAQNNCIENDLLFWRKNSWKNGMYSGAASKEWPFFRFSNQNSLRFPFDINGNPVCPFLAKNKIRATYREVKRQFMMMKSHCAVYYCPLWVRMRRLIGVTAVTTHVKAAPHAGRWQPFCAPKKNSWSEMVYNQRGHFSFQKFFLNRIVGKLRFSTL